MRVKLIPKEVLVYNNSYKLNLQVEKSPQVDT